MILVTNVTHTHTHTHSYTHPYHVQVFDSFPYTYTLSYNIIDTFGHSHAHYLSNMGGCNMIATYACAIKWLLFFLGTSECNNELVTLEAIKLTIFGPLTIFWRILTPGTDVKLYTNLSKLGTILKHTLVISIPNFCIQIPNFWASIITIENR